MKTRSGTTPHVVSEQPALGAVAVNGGNIGHTGWAAQRLAVVQQASGVCARCGGSGADTAFRNSDSSELLAGHTRCVVGLGPVATTTSGR